jgi:hypothetical protein
MLQCSIYAAQKEARMNANSKLKKDASSEASEKTGMFDETTTTAFTALLHRNVERMVNLQKATLDTLSRQSADVADTMRKFVKSSPAAPVAGMLDVAEQGIEGWVGAQKQMLDLMIEQSAQTLETARKRGGLASQSATAMSEFVQETAEKAVAAQKTMLDFAAKQNKAVAEAFRSQAGVKGSPIAEVAESVQRGVATFIDLQKEFIDTASKMAKDAAAGKA